MTLTMPARYARCDELLAYIDGAPGRKKGQAESKPSRTVVVDVTLQNDERVHLETQHRRHNLGIQRSRLDSICAHVRNREVRRPMTAI